MFKIKIAKRNLRNFWLVAAGCLLVFGAVAAADTIVQGFKSSVQYQPGWLVALSKSATATIELAPSNNPSRIFGVVVDPSSAPATVQTQGQQVFVANSGTYPALVSIQNGPISPGDYLSMSDTDGIAAKADASSDFVLGRAVESFDGQSKVITVGSDGSAIGKIRANIFPGKNPLKREEVAIPAPLKNLGQSIAGKPVSAIRVYAALVVFIIAALMATSLLWAGIRNGMVAIGRNPLSKHSILHGLFQVIIVALAVFFVGVFAVYLLLKI